MVLLRFTHGEWLTWPTGHRPPFLFGFAELGLIIFGPDRSELCGVVLKKLKGTKHENLFSAERPKITFAIGMAKKSGCTEIAKNQGNLPGKVKKFSIFSDLPESSFKTQGVETTQKEETSDENNEETDKVGFENLFEIIKSKKPNDTK